MLVINEIRRWNTKVPGCILCEYDGYFRLVSQASCHCQIGIVVKQIDSTPHYIVWAGLMSKIWKIEDISYTIWINWRVSEGWVFN